MLIKLQREMSRKREEKLPAHQSRRMYRIATPMETNKFHHGLAKESRNFLPHPHAARGITVFRPGKKWYWFTYFSVIEMLTDLRTHKFQIQIRRNRGGELIRMEVGARD